MRTYILSRLLHPRLAFAVALAGFLVSLAASLATPAAEAQLAICDRKPWLAQCQEVELPEDPPQPSVSPVGALDLARQTTDRGSVRVAGWTADGDAAQTPLQVKISINGNHATTVTADASRADVGAAHPHFGTAHGYAVTVPAAPTASEVCITAINVGSGFDSKWCKGVDQVAEFNANSISYDTANAVITGTNLDMLERLSYSNGTTVQQSTTFVHESQVVDTQSWTDTFSLKVSMTTSVKIPIIDHAANLTIEGSMQFVRNGSSATTRKFTWSQPVLVPAKSKVVAGFAVTKSSLVVPYTMSGSYIYNSGHSEPGSIQGTYSGVNSHDFEVTLTQFNLDGSPAAQPVAQPPAVISEIS